MGIPAFKYAVKLSLTLRAAATSATISVAAEPSSVKLPANVEDIANVNQACCAFGSVPISGRNNKTAGTFDTTLLSTPVVKLSAGTPPCIKGEAIWNKCWLNPVTSIAPVTMNKPPKKADTRLVRHLTVEEMHAILNAPTPSDWDGVTRYDSK